MCDVADFGVTTDGATTYINASCLNIHNKPVNRPIIFDLPLPPDVTKHWSCASFSLCRPVCNSHDIPLWYLTWLHAVTCFVLRWYVQCGKHYIMFTVVYCLLCIGDFIVNWFSDLHSVMVVVSAVIVSVIMLIFLLIGWVVSYIFSLYFIFLLLEVIRVKNRVMMVDLLCDQL